MATVEMEALGKDYGTLRILQDVSLDIDEGEFVVLVGPSGCGKSTLLRMIAGLETITSGTLRIAGRVVNDVEARERDIAMVFQSYALYPHMTVRQNIGFPLSVRRHDPSDIARAVDRVSQMTGLSELLDRKPRALSGGQRQRVAMGRSMIRDPKVFLFDEPLSNLDAKLRVQMRQQIRDLHRSVKATSIYVTHDQIEAMTLADRVVLLNDGRIQQVGTPMELYLQPANTFVAGFIGSPEMNFIDGVVRIKGDRPHITFHQEPAFSLPVQSGVAMEDGRKVVVGVRPEHLEPGTIGLPVRVLDAECLGPETVIFAEGGAGRLISVVRGIDAPGHGDQVRLYPDPAQIHLFDAESRIRIN
ncbi:MAG: sn-glycerol-3-phosphate ABC transporter ATP-binding protein UgpC [Nitratireductor rhodophyticola]|uniref:ABC transporter ATP-binding protein n=1 Tax=Nitratireductor rhodophyticola TaxID=2854036 RepID=UPI0032D8B58F